MNKYQKLASNTIILAIGQFSSKILSFVLTLLYANLGWFPPESMNSATNITNTANLLVVIFTISIVDGVIRYALERGNDGKQVLSIGISVALTGVLILLPFTPLLDSFFINYLQGSKGDGLLVVLFVLTSSIRSICSLYVRSIGLVKLYAIDGILATFTLSTISVIMMGGFKMGALGYVLSVLLSDIISVIFLGYMAGLYKQVRFFGMDKQMRRGMVRYSLPLMPAAAAWWAATASNSYFLTMLRGDRDSGLFNAASRISGLVSMATSIVTQAWQMSAVTEKNSRTIANFYSNVFNIYQSVVYVAAAGLIMVNRPVIDFLGSDYSGTHPYLPFLIIGIVFSCFANFLNSVYMADKKSGHSFLTAFFGSVLNILLNIILIPSWGVHGVTVASIINFLIVFIARAIDTRKIIYMNLRVPKIILNMAIIFIMSLSSMFDWSVNAWLAPSLFLVILLINFKTCIQAVNTFLKRK